MTVYPNFKSVHVRSYSPSGLVGQRMYGNIGAPIPDNSFVYLTSVMPC